MGNDNKHYKGNPNLKAENVSIEFTEEQNKKYDYIYEFNNIASTLMITLFLAINLFLLISLLYF